ncbi:MAG: bacillithiol biosynthesis deacetylase BshB1 [Actinobacteria bacterium]|nr:bacillithiol biosynthesis deacetylase BshB1 [Actinomycetota bacterium]
MADIKIDVLAFGPHPDDVEMGCGGLLLKLKKSGYKTGIIDLTMGELSSNGNIEVRQKETQDASNILNLDIRENLKLQDGNIINDVESRNKVIDIIRKYKPKLVLIPYYKDRHPDHENAHKLLKDSIFIAGLVKYETSLKFYRPDIVINYMLHFEFAPSFITDISDVFEKKVEAVTAYKSQFFSSEKKDIVTHISTKSFNDILHTRARYYGLKINTSFGEPYFINSKIKINDPVDFFSYVRF